MIWFLDLRKLNLGNCVLSSFLPFPLRLAIFSSKGTSRVESRSASKGGPAAYLKTNRRYDTVDEDWKASDVYEARRRVGAGLFDPKQKQPVIVGHLDREGCDL